MVTQKPPAPPKKTDEQIAELSPADREKYFEDQATAGVDDGGLVGWIQRIMAQAKGQAEADKVGDQNVKDMQGHDVRYVPGLQPSDADYLGNEHERLKSFVGTNLNAEQVTNVSTAYHKVHEAFNNFGKTLTEAVNTSKGEWSGTAAQSARGYFSSLGKWADANSTNAKLASETIYEQQTAASSAKNKMPEVVPFSMTDELGKWGSAKDPVAFADAVSNTYKTYDQSKKAHEEAAGVMSQYDKDLYAAASKQPAFAEPPKFARSGGGVVLKPIEGEGKRKTADSGDSNSTDSAGFTGGSTVLPGSGNLPGSPTPGGGDKYLPPTSPPPQVAPPGPSTGSGVLPGYTAPAGYQPTNLPPTSSNVPGANSGFGGMGAMPMGGMGGGFGGAGGESEYTKKVGRGGGFGPGGGGGSGSSSTPGSGNSSGAARPGGVGAADAAAGRGMGQGAGGGPGRGGAGGMGAGRGQGSQGEEDQEHQRPTYLVEGDPDEVFGSDVRTAPPVIGE